MKFSGKIEDGTSNKPLNFGIDPWPWLRFALSVEIQLKVIFYLTPKGRPFNSISDPVASAEVRALRELLVIFKIADASKWVFSFFFFFFNLSDKTQVTALKGGTCLSRSTVRPIGKYPSL